MRKSNTTDMKLLCCLSFLFVGLSVISGNTLYKAEGIFVIDKQAIDAYMREIPGTFRYQEKREKAMHEIRRDILYILSEVNKIFVSFQPEFTMELYGTAMYYLRYDISSNLPLLAGTTNGINDNVLLNTFDGWLNFQQDIPRNYDFALLWTGFDLYGEDGYLTTGHAHVGKICNQRLATGVGEFNMTYETVLTTARVIAQILGAHYDGLASHYIMRPIMSTEVENRWSFSNCSTRNIGDYLKTLSPNCLLTKFPNSSFVSQTYEAYTGQMYNVDAICKRRVNNSNSYMFREWAYHRMSPPGGDLICKVIPCRWSGSFYEAYAYPSEGMVCDVGKRCQKGRCIPDRTATTNITSNCVFGNQQDCGHDLYDSFGLNNCYLTVHRQRCCALCNAYYTGRPNCEYGDWVTHCSHVVRNTFCQGDTHDCCEYCRTYNETTTK